MPSKTKEARLEQKTYLEAKLNERLAALAEQGMEPGSIAKDRGVRKLRADLRSTNERLAVIEGRAEKNEEMARHKAEKQAAPKVKDKGKKGKDMEEQPEMSKRQKKKLEKQKEKQNKGENSD